MIMIIEYIKLYVKHNPLKTIIYYNKTKGEGLPNFFQKTPFFDKTSKNPTLNKGV